MSKYAGYFLWRRDSHGNFERTHHRPAPDPLLSPEDNEKRGWKSDQAARKHKNRHKLHGLVIRREDAPWRRIK